MGTLVVSVGEAVEDFDKNGAIADYTAVIGLEPKYASAYARRALVYLDLKRKGEAAADLQRAFQLDPSLRSDYGEHLKEALKK